MIRSAASEAISLALVGSFQKVHDAHRADLGEECIA